MEDAAYKDIGNEILASWALLQDYNPTSGKLFEDSAESLSIRISKKFGVCVSDVYNHPLWHVAIPMLPVTEALMFKLVGGKHNGKLIGAADVDTDYLRSLVSHGVELSSRGRLCSKVALWQYAAATALVYKIRERWCLLRGKSDAGVSLIEMCRRSAKRTSPCAFRRNYHGNHEEAAQYIHSKEPRLWESLDLLAPVQSTINERETCGTSGGGRASTGAKKRAKGKSEDTQLLFGV